MKITIEGIDDATQLYLLSDAYEVEGKNLSVSDGYHTFDELYDHRITLYIALCALVERHSVGVWRSELHSDGSRLEGWFVLGICAEPGQQITYHLPMARWAETNFAPTLERAPEFDGHTSADVLERLKRL
jgi:hypothetical protein